jgi:uncharacterized protein YkwD
MRQVSTSSAPQAVLLLCLALAAGCTVTTVAPGDSGPISPAPASADCPAPPGLAADSSALLALINAERVGAGLSAVRLSPALSAVAQQHACDNAARSSTSHQGSDGSDLSARLRRGGIAISLAAENTGLGFSSPEAAFAWWMGSPDHRANILLPQITQIGIGKAQGAKTAWVINFIR